MRYRVTNVTNSITTSDGIDEETVDFEPNYSGETIEPKVLPGRFPNLLINGAKGLLSQWLQTCHPIILKKLQKLLSFH